MCNVGGEGCGRFAIGWFYKLAVHRVEITTGDTYQRIICLENCHLMCLLDVNRGLYWFGSRSTCAMWVLLVFKLRKRFGVFVLSPNYQFALSILTFDVRVKVAFYITRRE